MKKSTTWVGMDAHKKFISVAVLQGRRKAFVEWKVNHDERTIKRLANKLVRLAEGGEVRCCYEAGPCGYALKRKLEEAAPLVCEVIAPSLIPVKPGDRIKTDRRDARKLAELLRAGLLTEVSAPTEEEESVRDLCRCREAIRDDLMRARHRLMKFLLRHGRIYAQGSSWTLKHSRWLRSIQFEDQVCQAVFEEYMLEVEHLNERHKTIKEKLEDVSQSEPYRQVVGWLKCFHGVEMVTAMTILAELHDIRRFGSARQLMSYLGMTPSEKTSVVQKRGGITKAGNSHVRRVLVETAHQYRRRPVVGINLNKRRQGQPGAVIAIANKAHQRLSRRYLRLLHKGKSRNKVVVAVARELVGFIWAMLYEQDYGFKEALDSSN